MDELRHWLNSNKNYDEGVRLLLKHSSDERMKRLYTIEGPSDFKKLLLQKELQKIYSRGAKPNYTSANEHPKPSTPQTLHLSTFQQNPSKWPAKMDEVVAALFHQWKPLFAERNDLCSRLYAVAKINEHQAGQMAHRILDLDDLIDAIYDKRDHYLQHGVLPNDNKPKKMVVDPVKMVVALKNAERYVREFRRKLKAQPDNVRWAAKLKQWEETVIYYKKELKIDE